MSLRATQFAGTVATFARRLAAIAIKRASIFMFGAVAGLLAPLLSLPQLYSGTNSYSDTLRQMAMYLYSEHQFTDLIAACFPVMAVCLTDFTLHLTGTTYNARRTPIVYYGLWLMVACLIIMFVVLTASFVSMPRTEAAAQAVVQRHWFTDFDTAWFMVKLVFASALIFELGLAFVESRAAPS